MAKCSLNSGSNSAENNNFVSDANEELVFESRVDSIDNIGGYSISWNVAFTGNAKIEPISKTSNKEVFEYGKINEREAYKVFLNYSSQIDAKMRVVYDGRYFDIMSVLRNNNILELQIERLV